MSCTSRLSPVGRLGGEETSSPPPPTNGSRPKSQAILLMSPLMSLHHRQECEWSSLPLLLLRSLFFSLRKAVCLFVLFFVNYPLKTACSLFFLSTALKMSTDDVMRKKREVPVPVYGSYGNYHCKNWTASASTLCESSDARCRRPCRNVCSGFFLFGSRVVGVCPLQFSSLQLSGVWKHSPTKKHNLACTTNTEAAPSMTTNF